jgi:hypothetical protein
MEKHVEGKINVDACKKAVRTQRLIIFAMMIFAVVPFLIAWMNGSLRF